MKEKRVTKKAIFASLLSVVVCSSMLIGTSYAWFTDTASSNGNIIKSGTLNIKLEKYDEEIKDYAEVDGPIYTYDKWEPGYVSWTNLKVSTTGNLALKYTLNFTSDENLADSKLAEAIEVYYVPQEVLKDNVLEELDKTRVNGDDLVALGFRNLGTLQDAFKGNEKFTMVDYLIPDPKDGEEVDADDEATLVLIMPEDKGNEYQTLETPMFDITLFATQWTYEKDTFNDQYDDKANGIPDYPEFGKLNTYAYAPKSDEATTTVNGVGASLTVNTDAITGDTAALTVAPADTPDGFQVGDDNLSVTYDIKVDGVSDTALKTVKLTIGSGKNNVVVYHTESGATTAMTKLASVDGSTEGYFYDPATGELTIVSDTFSPFTIVYAKPVVVKGEEEAAEAIENAESGDTVVVAGNTKLPTAIAENVLIKGTSDGTTQIDTVAVSGANTGNINGVTFENVEMTSTSAVNFSDGWGGDWDGIISHKTTLTDTTFKDCDFSATATENGRVNAIYGGTANGVTLFENCNIAADVYGVNFSYVNGTLVFKNCDITGWNSFGGAKAAGGESKVIFENCRFHKSAYYGVVRFYQDGEFNNCTFDNDFVYVDCNASGKTITFTDCSGLNNNQIFNNNTNTNTWIVNGVTLENVASH